MNQTPSRHHLRLLEASNTIQQNPDDVERAFMARQLVQVTLPHADPGNVSLWNRKMAI